MKALALTAGADTTIYTVPAGKSAYFLDGNQLPASTGQKLFYLQQSGSTKFFYIYAVPSGGTKGGTNQLSASNSGSGVKQPINLCMCLNSGDFIVITTVAGGSGQVWFNVVEI